MSDYHAFYASRTPTLTSKEKRDIRRSARMIRDDTAARYFEWARAFLENAKFFDSMGNFWQAELERILFRSVMRKVKALPQAPRRLP